MTRLKQKTVTVGDQRQRIELVQLQNQHPELFNGEYMYVVRDMDYGDRLEDPVATRQEAERLFRRTVDHIERGMESTTQRGQPGPGFMSDSTPFVPDRETDADGSTPTVPENVPGPGLFEMSLPDPGAKDHDGPFEIQSQMDPTMPWNDDDGGDDESDGWLL